MRSLQRLPLILCVAAVLGADIRESTGGVSIDKRPAEKVTASYKTAEEIKAMRPCRATVERRVVCYVVLKSADGQKFHIGSPGNTAEVHGFIDTLEEGRTYSLPSAFIAYQKKLPQ
jgi:hypothetical protein